LECGGLPPLSNAAAWLRRAAAGAAAFQSGGLRHRTPKQLRAGVNGIIACMANVPDEAVEKIRRGESLTPGETLAMTVEQRLALVWELTKVEWGITDETPMRRDIARVIRRGDPAD